MEAGALILLEDASLFFRLLMFIPHSEFSKEAHKVRFDPVMKWTYTNVRGNKHKNKKSGRQFWKQQELFQFLYVSEITIIYIYEFFDIL